MKSNYLFIIVMFLSILFAVFLVAGEDKKVRSLAAKKDSNTMKEDVPYDQQATQKEIQFLMDRFSRKNKIDILRTIKRRSIELDKRESDLNNERQVFDKSIKKMEELIDNNIKKNEKEVEEIIAMKEGLDKRIDNLKKAIASLDVQYQKEEQEKLKKLIKSFKNMNPKRAALIVPEMSLNLAAQVMLALPSRNSAQIIERLNPKTAAKLSHLMAEQKKQKKLRDKVKEIFNKR